MILLGEILLGSERNKIEDEMGRFKGFKNNLKNEVLYDHLTSVPAGSPSSHCLLIWCLSSIRIFKDTWVFFNGFLKQGFYSILPLFYFQNKFDIHIIKIKHTGISRCHFPGFSGPHFLSWSFLFFPYYASSLGNKESLS